MVYSPHSTAVDFIDEYLRERPESHFESCDSVATILMDWVERGDGVLACHADFETFLLTVIAIREYWHEHQESTNGIRYRKYTGKDGDFELTPITSFLGDKGLSHPIFDRRWFNAAVFDNVHANRLLTEWRR